MTSANYGPKSVPLPMRTAHNAPVTAVYLREGPVMIRRAALISILLLLVSTATVSAGTEGATVSIQNFFFNPATVKVNVGEFVGWTNNSDRTHTSTARLFNAWNLSIGSSGHASTLFVRAGTFAYFCTIHSQMQGNVKVKMNATPASGTTSTNFSIRVATQDAPSGFVEQVQRRKHGRTFKPWVNTAGQTLSWTPSRAATWEFRARLRRISDGTVTGWSPVLKVVVS